jgi:hypothetical protein
VQADLFRAAARLQTVRIARSRSQSRANLGIEEQEDESDSEQEFQAASVAGPGPAASAAAPVAAAQAAPTGATTLSSLWGRGRPAMSAADFVAETPVRDDTAADVHINVAH